MVRRSVTRCLHSGGSRKTPQLRRTVSRCNYRLSRNPHAEWRHLLSRLTSESRTGRRSVEEEETAEQHQHAATAAPRRDRKTTRVKPRALRALDSTGPPTRGSAKGFRRGKACGASDLLQRGPQPRARGIGGEEADRGPRPATKRHAASSKSSAGIAGWH